MINTQFIDRLHRVRNDLIPLVILQFPKTNESYQQLLAVTKGINHFSKSLKSILSHITYGPQIRHHFTLKSIDKYGHIRYQLNGNYHREYNQPAVIRTDESKVWYQHGNLHRDGDLPAIIYADGTQLWYQHGQRHRDGHQPASVWPNGTEEWWQHGKFIRNSDGVINNRI